jgi:hypothetical protein
MSTVEKALTHLLQLDGKTVPDGIGLEPLLKMLGGLPWLRFALGVQPGEPMPAGDEEGLRSAAVEFSTGWAIWEAYRTCAIELRPPNSPPVRFAIDPAVPGTPPAQFPASTLAVITAWNPGSGEPRPNPRANIRANERLAAHLDARMVERWPAVNAPKTRWEEESFCVLGLSLDEAWRLGEAFQQRAIYYVDQGRPFLVGRRRGRIATWEGEIKIVR